MANPRKPTHLKAVAGTQQKCREAPPSVDIPPVAVAPDPPDWLPNVHAVREWKRLVPILMANRLLTDADLSALANLCALQGKITQLFHAGETPTASLLGTLRNMQNDFGLAPVARGKVKPVNDTPKANPFAATRRGGKPA